MSIVLYVGLVILYVLVGLVVAIIVWAWSGPSNLESVVNGDYHIGGWLALLWPVAVVIASIAGVIIGLAYVPKTLGRVAGRYGGALRARMPSIFGP